MMARRRKKIWYAANKEDPGGDEESSFIVELKMNIILGGISLTINEVKS